MRTAIGAPGEPDPDDNRDRGIDPETLYSGITPFNILQAKAYLAGMKAIDLSKNPPEPSAIKLVPSQVSPAAQRGAAYPSEPERP